MLESGKNETVIVLHIYEYMYVVHNYHALFDKLSPKIVCDVSAYVKLLFPLVLSEVMRQGRRRLVD